VIPEMTAFDWIWELNFVCGGFFSTEKPKKKASNSELKRWIENGSIVINGTRCKAVDPITSITEIILFPKSDKRRNTMIF
jgi:23S rRNA-/tRNA-specific pseudouridylate synthase